MNRTLKLVHMRRFATCERGAAAVELALILSVLTTLVLGLLTYAQAIHQSIALQHAARAGAEYALRFPNDPNGIQQAVAGAGTVDPTGLTVTTSQFCECPDGTSVDCSSTCGGSTLPNQYVNVAVAQPAMDTLANTGVLDGRIRPCRRDREAPLGHEQDEARQCRPPWFGSPAALRDRSGATAIEFALTLPVFLLFVFGLVEFSRVLWTNNALEYGAEQAARYALANPTASASELQTLAASQVPTLNAAA